MIRCKRIGWKELEVSDTQQDHKLVTKKSWKVEAAAAEHATLVYRNLLAGLEAAGSSDPVEDALVFANNADPNLRARVAECIIRARLKFFWEEGGFAIVSTSGFNQTNLEVLTRWSEDIGWTMATLEETIAFATTHEDLRIEGAIFSDFMVLDRRNESPVAVGIRDGATEQWPHEGWTVNKLYAILLRKSVN
jgi:hypothetical protein